MTAFCVATAETYAVKRATKRVRRKKRMLGGWELGGPLG